MKLGRISERIQIRTILKRISFKRSETLTHAGVGEYCAVFDCADKNCVVTTDTIADFTLGGYKNLFLRCLNNLAAKGAEPVAVQILVVVNEDFEEESLKEMMGEFEALSKLYSVEISDVSVRVSQGVVAPTVTIVAIGLRERACSLATARPGDDLVVTKWVGLEGTSLIAASIQDKLKEKFPSHMVIDAINFDRLLSIIPEAATAGKSGVSAMYSLSEGGIFKGLWELADASGVGLEIDLRKIPVKQETIEIANYADINPYALLSGGSLLIATDDGNKLVLDLEKIGVEATIIGKCTDNNDRVLLNEDNRRFLELCVQDEIYKLN